MSIDRVGDFTLQWGESLVWDEQRSRLYFVDTLGMALHWLDDGSTELQTFVTPQMPSGMVATPGGQLVVTMDDGLYVVDADAGSCSLLAAYPSQLDGRCNDMCADLDGNLITGKLNLGPAEGSSWWYQPSSDTWKLIDDDISNTNGPTVAELDGAMTLVIGDSSKHYFAYDYEPSTGTVGPRRMFGDVTELGPSPGTPGVPDGATLDDQSGLWCALPRSGKLVRFTTKGLDGEIEVPFEFPTDVTFGGPDLDKLYVVAVNEGLYVVDGVGRGRVEPRAAL
ncbi:MAG TPA: SMP-30/gluconolactonase/LRE family protein [Acidimicrobiales bacterium]|nr:SMP-30/gluconolactonase/LRE family protein [Acidimicrobiales bacterium]